MAKKKTEKKKSPSSENSQSASKLIQFPAQTTDSAAKNNEQSMDLNELTLQKYVLDYYHTDTESETITIAALAQVFEKVIDETSYLLGEQEFCDISLTPDRVFSNYAAAEKFISDKYGSPDEITEAEFEAVSSELIVKMGEIALEQGLNSDIQVALIAILKRALAANNKKLMADCAVNLFVLRNEFFRLDWPALPVCFGKIEQSLEMLEEFSEVFESMVQISDADGENAAPSPETLEKLQELINKSPALQNYIDTEIDNPWLLGLEAIMDGHIEFDVSNADDLAFTREVMERFPPDIVNMLAIEEESEMMNNFLEYLEDTIIPHFERAATPERIDQLRKKTDEKLLEIDPADQSYLFFQMLKTELEGPQPECSVAHVLWNVSVARINDENNQHSE